MSNCEFSPPEIDLNQVFPGAEKEKGSLSAVRIPSGHMHDSWCLSETLSGQPRFVLQRLNPIFNLKAVNNNLILLEKAQPSCRNLPSYWQTVHYFSAPNSPDKIYYDKKGVAWRLMEYVPGEIFDSFGQVPPEKKAEVAYSLGEAIAVFDQVLSRIPAEMVETPLPRFHDTGYHFDYFLSILSGETVPLSLSQEPFPEVSLNRDFYGRYFQRIETLRQKIFARSELINCLDGLGQAVLHNDLKINNAVFSQVEGSWRCVTLIDLDTIQKGACLDDLGDALRSAGNPAGEEPESLDKVFIDEEIVGDIIAGFISTYKKYHGREKAGRLKRLAPLAYKKHHFELTMRFFADSLVGNRYFKLRPDQPEDLNLYRAEVQMKALEEIERIYLV